MTYTSYSSHFNVGAYQNQFITVDDENDPFELRVTGNDIEEIQKLDILGIPFSINFHWPLNKTMGVYLLTGINFFVPLKKTYQSSGIFTYKGYFPE